MFFVDFCRGFIKMSFKCRTCGKAGLKNLQNGVKFAKKRSLQKNEKNLKKLLTNRSECGRIYEQKEEERSPLSPFQSVEYGIISPTRAY